MDYQHTPNGARTVEAPPGNPDPTDYEAVRAEVEAEQASNDGSIVVTLSTDLGEADIRVPPLSRWRSQARAALFTRGDDLTWAARTLSRDDAQAWAELDPTQEETNTFFAEWGRLTGQSLGGSRAERRSSARTHRR